MQFTLHCYAIIIAQLCKCFLQRFNLIRVFMKQLLLLILMAVSATVNSQTIAGQKFELTRTGENDYTVTVEGELGEGEVWVYGAFSDYFDYITSMGTQITTDELYGQMKACIGQAVGTHFFDNIVMLGFGQPKTENTFTFQKALMDFFVVGKAMTDEEYTALSVGGTLDIPPVGDKAGDTMGIGRVKWDKNSVGKVIENGRIVIIRRGVRYNPLGQRLD